MCILVRLASISVLFLTLLAAGVSAGRGAGLSPCPDADSSCHNSDTSLLQTKSVRARLVSPQEPPPLDDSVGKAVPHAASDKWNHLLHAALAVMQVAAFVATLGFLMNRLIGCFRPSAGMKKRSPELDIVKDVKGVAEGRRHCAEIKVGGMTCSACSSTVERSLSMEKGVVTASVNLVLEKAVIVFDASVTTAEALCEAVEDVGFDSAILSQGPASEMQDEGRATLHLELDSELVEALGSFAQGVEGVVSFQRLEPRIIRIAYRPSSIGARTLLAQFRAQFAGSTIDPAPPQENTQTADLQRTADRLWFNFQWSAVPASLVFVITIIFPAAGIDLGNIDCRFLHLHVATLAVLALATPVQFIFGADFHVQARKALVRKSPNMDVLVSLATSISFGYALLVLIDMACKALGHHSSPEHMDMVHSSGHDPGIFLGLGCHALHFFGMAPILMAVVLCGKFIETKAKIQTMESLVRLMESKSQTAQLVTEEKEEAISVELVQVGDTLRFYEGSQIPVDGVLISEDTAWVSEAILTGESVPNEKTKGSILMGGTTVSSGSGLMKATTVGSKTALGEIMTLISNAQATKTKTQQLANTVAGIFVTAVMACSILVFLVWLFLVYTKRVELPKDMDAKSNFDIVLFAAKFGVAVLMVACPCAMGLATPTAVMVSTGVAAKMGCLVKSAEALEAGLKVRTLVLDKTGTITEGAPRVSSVALALSVLDKLPSSSGVKDKEAESCDLPSTLHLGSGCGIVDQRSVETERLERNFWWFVGAAEAGSDHPIAKCLVDAAQSASGCATFATPDQFRYRVGRGVSAVFGGVDIRVGSFAFLEESLKELKQELGEEARQAETELEEWAAHRRASMDSVVVVHAVIDKKVCLLGAVAVRDAVRADAVATIRYLQQRGIDVWMCTGDGRSTALAIAKEVGIPEDHVCAEALPKQKADKVEALRAESSGSVCFVGDGVNDAPALAGADVGVAIGAGAHLAMDAADVVLVRSELATLVAYLKLSRETVWTIRRNYAWAFVFNFVGLPAAAGIFYPHVVLPPLVAGLAMGVSSALVVSSSLLLRFFSPPRLSR